MSYELPPTPHATLSSAVTQGVVTANIAYPLLFESADDLQGMYRASGTVSINSASPCTVTCVSPSTTLLATGAPIQFTAISDGTKGLALSTTYYVTNIAGGAGSFQLSSTIALARAGTADKATTGAITGTYECISRIYFPEAGDYLVCLSALLDTTGVTGSTAQFMDVWFVMGNSTTDLVGTNVAKSNTQVAIDRAGAQMTVAVPIIVDAAKADFLRLDYHGDDTRLRWLAVAAGTTPTRPACPSVLLTINKTGR